MQFLIRQHSMLYSVPQSWPSSMILFQRFCDLERPFNMFV